MGYSRNIVLLFLILLFFFTLLFLRLSSNIRLNFIAFQPQKLLQKVSLLNFKSRQQNFDDFFFGSVYFGAFAGRSRSYSYSTIFESIVLIRLPFMEIDSFGGF